METINFFFEKPLNRYGMYLMSKKTFEQLNDGVVESLLSTPAGISKMQRKDPTLADRFKKFLDHSIHREVVLPDLGEFVKFEK